MTTQLALRTAPQTYELFHPQVLLVNDVQYQPQFFEVADDGELAAIGVYRVDVTPPEGQRWTGAFTDSGGLPVAVYEDIPVSATDVDAERDRRAEHGFVFGGVSYQLDEKSISRITAMGADARFAVFAGKQPGDLRWADPDNDFGWIATDNSVTPMDAQTMAAFADAAKIWVARHTFAARAIKDMTPIPADYADNAYWP